MSNKKSLAALCGKAMLIGLCSFFMTGCTTETGKIPSKSDVLKEVSEVAPTEQYELDHVDKRNTTPREAEYFFQSKERDLEFTALSTLQQISGYFGTWPFYNKRVYVNYVECVHMLYYDETMQILNSSSYYSPDKNKVDWSSYAARNMRFDIDHYSDVESVAKTLAAISDLYSAELQYNTEEWVKEYPLINVHVKWFTHDEELSKTYKYGETVKAFDITGLDDYDYFLRQLQIGYAKLMRDELIPYDEDMPQSVMDELHADKLDYIYVNDRLMEDGMANSTIDGHYNDGRDVFTASYSYDYDCYLIRIDVGSVEEKCNPHPFPAYIKAAGGSGGDVFKSSKQSWTIGNDSFELESTWDKKKGIISDVVVKKNGKLLDVRPLTGNSFAGATYNVAYTVDDIAQLFDLDYEIDEEQGAIYFRSK